MQPITRRLTYHASDKEAFNDRDDKKVGPNEPVADNGEAFNNGNMSKNVTPDRLMAEGKEVLDDNHEEAKVRHDGLVANNEGNNIVCHPVLLARQKK